ncbi:hypothetical protein NLG97_g8134 [Lecanicillium saksenae]|uniref:Uncharacterized protein n=1 Tax=Lecanicillium saksenae TaxID=468837 RepID=A0ACC1QNN0_9HYPO|nr:hypothetical protein NLG97_g8134 [Lecanicillium saksenae]
MTGAALLGGHGKKHKVTVVGSGNWGSTISKIVAENAKLYKDLFEPEVQMWVFEEDVVIPSDSKHAATAGGEPQKLTHIINKYHENVKYLPGITLPSNLIANPSIHDAVKDSTILIFNLPHQFIHNLHQGRQCVRRRRQPVQRVDRRGPRHLRRRPVRRQHCQRDCRRKVVRDHHRLRSPDHG